MKWYVWVLLTIILFMFLRYVYHAVPTYVYLIKAKQGDPEAQFQLALRYSFGYGIKRDNSKSSFWMEKAVTLPL
jgi:TPR repeat protein